ncbi:MAG: phosphotransferase [bacterium]|nr:phosphotransferase [bacterium]
MSDFLDRLEQFLASRGLSAEFEQLTPDASTREYFRVDGGIVCIYPEAFDPAEQSYLDVTKLFLDNGLPVANIKDFDESLGAIMIEDFGDRILREEMKAATPERREELIDAAIDLIPRIQTATDAAYETNSIASRLKFDVEKLNWELNFFKEHYFTTFKKKPLSAEEDTAISAEFLELSQELENRATVLCHRDFHAANLMLDADGNLKIIDHQDARIGSPAYDLVSLLLDRVTELPSSEWLAGKRRRLLDGRESLGLPHIDEAAFTEEFRLQTIQRCLKAAGTFSFQSANRGKTYFVPFIQPMFRIALRALDNLGGFPAIRTVLESEISQTRT